MKKVNKMNFLLEETSKWLLSLGLIISMGACSDNDSDENVPNPGHTPLTDVQVAPRNPYLASEHYSITHFNSAQTDAFPYAVKDGIFTVNPENCASTSLHLRYILYVPRFGYFTPNRYRHGSGS